MSPRGKGRRGSRIDQPRKPAPLQQTQPTPSPPRPDDVDFVARAFGFRSANHMQRVIDGKDPSALEYPQR